AILGVKFKVSPLSFYQVNPKQTEVLYKKAIEFAELQPSDVVLDAYCGVGTIGLCLANKVKQVTGVEIVKSAIEDAKENAKVNDINNAEFYCEDAKDFIQTAASKGLNYDVVVVDPPRNGCDPTFIESLLIMKPKKIVYVSCEPSSLARDIKLLKNAYDVIKCQPVDMFPQTYHVETVVALVLKK
ncbi:MAG: 23S rRNA (uracil(1939)-C(5))-methyltransferase RlmD, partial [Bacilli bacterium]|nr:23S rRNA (uracil(1939)-C(5))-methyltransferase RlmD [Bacilli bacterium]